MSKNDKKKTTGKHDPNEKVVAVNRKARHNYHVLDSLECGIVLVGSEVKSLRNGQLSLEEAYGRMKDNEVWLIGCDIPEYVEANQLNHVPKRPRKLLLHRREINKVAAKAYQTGYTLVPLQLHFRNGRAKVVLGVCQGKREHDKRDTLKKQEAQRDIARAVNKSLRRDDR